MTTYRAALLLACALGGALTGALTGCGGGSSGGGQPAGNGGAFGAPAPAPEVPVASSALAYQSIARANQSGVSTKRNVVIKDQAAWARLWAEHVGPLSPAPTLPQVDFTRQLLIGVFAGELPSGCQQFGVRGVFSAANRLRVEVEQRNVSDLARCLPAVTHPMHIVAIDRDGVNANGDADFVDVTSSEIAFTTLAQDPLSNIASPRAVAVKDAAAWASLWAEHAGTSRPLPQVDFQRNMVLAVFRGTQPGGCYPTTITSVARSASKISVLHADSVPGPLVFCTHVVTAPSHMVLVERSDLPVEFATERTVAE